MINITIFILFIILILIIVFIILSFKQFIDVKSNAIGGTTLDQPPASLVITYTISGEGNGLNYSIFRKMLNAQNKITCIEKPINEKVHMSFGSFGGFKNKKTNLNLNPEFYKQHASIKNVLDGHSGFINKTELYQTIKKNITTCYF